MRKLVARYRWTSWLAATALAFQVFALVLTTPMEVARGLPMAAADHCKIDGHHDAPASAGDLCQVCIGMQVAGHGVTPLAPPLPLPIVAPCGLAAAIAIEEAPPLDTPRPQNPRAPPFLI